MMAGTCRRIRPQLCYFLASREYLINIQRVSFILAIYNRILLFLIFIKWAIINYWQDSASHETITITDIT